MSAGAPGPLQPQQPPPYIIAGTAPAKRVRLIDPSGGEEHADENPWLHMRLRGAEEDTQGDDATAAAAAPGGADEDEPMRPEEVVEAFACARGELDWLLALLTRLKEARHLAVARADRGPAQRVADMAQDKATRVARRVGALSAAAASLEEGATALAAAGAREDAFYAQLARLQRFWLLRMPPPDSPYAFMVSLGIGPDGTPTPTAPGANTAAATANAGSAGAKAATAAKAGTAAAAAAGGGAAAAAAAAAGAGDDEGWVPLLKDPSGRVRVQIDAPRRRDEAPSVTAKRRKEAPAVYAGTPAVHALLLSRQQRLLWRTATELLESEMLAVASGRLPAALQAAGSVGADAASEGPGGGSGAGAARGASSGGALLAPAAPAPGLQRFGALCRAVLQRLAADAIGGGSGGGSGVHVMGSSAASMGGPLSTLSFDAFSPLGSIGFDDGLSMGSGGGAGFRQDDPSLLSLRPLVLQHVLHTQLRHLLGSFPPGAAALHAGAAGARAIALKRGGGASGRRGLGGPGGERAPRPTLLATLGRWLVHGSSRELLRAELDRQLAASPGVIPQTLATCGTCTSAIKLLPPSSPASSSANGGPAVEGRSGNRGGGGALPALVLLTSSNLTIEGVAPPDADPAALVELEGRQRVSDLSDAPSALAAVIAALQGLPQPSAPPGS